MRSGKLSTALASIVLGACATASGPAPAAPVDDGIEVRLGCTIVARRQVDEALAAAERAGRSVSREEVRDEVVHRVVIHRFVDQLRVEVDDADVDRALDAVAAQNGVSRDELWQLMSEQGLDRAAYREEVRFTLLERRVAALLMDPLEEARVRVELRRRQARGEESVYGEILGRAYREAFERVTAELRRTRVRGHYTGCVEVDDERQN